MALVLVIRIGDDELSATFDQPRVVIGRSEGCDFRIPDLSVSHRHASIRQRGSDYTVVDEGSENGTFLRKMRLHPYSPVPFPAGSMLRLGRVWVQARVEAAMPTSHLVRATREIALVMAGRVLDSEGSGGIPRLVVLEGPDAGMEVNLKDPGRSVVIGRGREADMSIDVDGASRRHARVVRRGDVAMLRDLGSRNGTVVGDSVVGVEDDVTLRPGDRFAIGPDLFAFENPAVEALREIEAAEAEQMRSDEIVEMPDIPGAVCDEQEESGDQEGVEEPRHDEEAYTDVRRVYPRNERISTKDKRSGWGNTDIVVVLLAIGVLAVSIFCILWLFRDH
ncbi:MAG: FHA domain-containing protein [Polyangiaceae bacterium]|nr:FHA domain-containing protein [Polyangiaceae bacterium]